MVGKYKVITLCGSTRFKDAYLKAQKDLTLKGYIVISVGLFGHSGDSEVWENMDEGTRTQTKRMLDDMHKRKIDMADEILVINVGDYIGDSTREEIAYAKTHGKRVNYLEPHKVMYENPTDHQAGAAVPWEREPEHSSSENRGDAISEQSGWEQKCPRPISPDQTHGTQKSFKTGSTGQTVPEKITESDDSDLEALDSFLRSTSREPSRIYSPDDATAAMIAYQNGQEDDSPEGDGSGASEMLYPGEGAEGEDTEAEDADFARKAYILDMLRNGYDIPNTAYFLDMDEKEVRKIWEEAQGQE